MWLRRAPPLPQLWARRAWCSTARTVTDRVEREFDKAMQIIMQEWSSKRSASSGSLADVRVAVALSGGPDSMALASLTRSWILSSGRDLGQLLCLTVDHRLRAGSGAEAPYWRLNHQSR